MRRESLYNNNYKELCCLIDEKSTRNAYVKDCT